MTDSIERAAAIRLIEDRRGMYRTKKNAEETTEAQGWFAALASVCTDVLADLRALPPSPPAEEMMSRTTQLRWIAPEGTSTERPILQARQVSLDYYGDWYSVPIVVLPVEEFRTAARKVGVLRLRPAMSNRNAAMPNTNKAADGAETVGATDIFEDSPIWKPKDLRPIQEPPKDS